MDSNINLVENKNKKLSTYQVYIDGEPFFNQPVIDERLGKVQDFDECCKATIAGKTIKASYLSF